MNKVDDCLSGECLCRNASACVFGRCKNCDYPVGKDGLTLVDHGGESEKLDVCPDCGGPLNERKIYGGLNRPETSHLEQ